MATPVRCWLFGHSWLIESGWSNGSETFNVDDAGRWGVDVYICGNCLIKRGDQQ